MVGNKKYFMLVPVFLGVFLFFGFSGYKPEKPKTGFWAMEGTLVTHYFEEETDPLSGPELFELQDEKGLPIWFSRHIFKDVCISGECKMIRLWLFWDGAGNYLGIQTHENEPLTKSDHTKFEPADYEKMDRILADSASILKTLKQEELIIVPENINPFKVDGYTAATQPTLAEVVVKNAVYTCHTLWHTVYGPVQTQIHEILKIRLSNEFLRKAFESEKPELISWAIESVDQHPQYHPDFYPEVLPLIKSENSSLASQALSYFRTELLEDTVIQNQLVQIMADVDMSVKYEILWKFIGFGQIHEKTVLDLLTLFARQKIGVGAYNLVLKLVTAEHLNNNEQIAQIMKDFSEADNMYIRNLTKRTLDEKLKVVSP